MKPARPGKERGYLCVRPPDVEQITVSAGLHRVASERTVEIFDGWCWQKGRVGDRLSLEMLLRSCYLQGAHDMAVAQLRGASPDSETQENRSGD